MTNLDITQIVAILLSLATATGITASIAWLKFKAKLHDIRNVVDDFDNIVQAGQVTSAQLKDIIANLKDLVT